MTTRIGMGGPATNVVATTTAPRVTPPTRSFQQVMTDGSLAVLNGAEAAMTQLPGGSLLAATMRSSTTRSAALPSALSMSATGSTGTVASAPPFSGLGGLGGLGTTSGTSAGGGDPAVEQMMGQDANQNLYYLQLQEQMSQESRSYSAVSNVLKARHDTMKNAIGNIR